MTDNVETCQYVINKEIKLDIETFCLFINKKFNKSILNTVINKNDSFIQEYINIARINNRFDLVELHSEDNLRLLVDDLVSAFELGADREDIVQILKEHGRRATYWGR
ncbi:hypothetical protein [Macrococcus armenti]|nr:hypothetical protein [Macrococcus armenti]UBH09968.1 hypothetical protein LAU38_06670 [Macrococcus armenti]